MLPFKKELKPLARNLRSSMTDASNLFGRGSGKNRYAMSNFIVRKTSVIISLIFVVQRENLS